MADDRLIVALDVDSFDKMKSLVERLGDSVSFYKIGMELYYGAGRKTVRYLREHHKKIFLDLKLHDIPNTVGHSVSSVTRLGIHLITVHATGGRSMIAAASKAARCTAEELGVECPKILAVTVLTSFDDQGWAEIGGHLPIQEHVLRLAEISRDAGADGVIASPHEAAAIRRVCGSDFAIVTPGIRPAFARTDDQRRVATPAQALQDGASQLVIGRPITQADDPAEAVKMILNEMRGR